MFSMERDKTSLHQTSSYSLVSLRRASLILVVLCTVIISFEVSAKVSPDDVYHEVLLLERQIDSLRQATNNTKPVKQPPPQQYKQPVHVFAKTLEVRRKLSRVMELYGLAEIQYFAIPSAEITSEDVLKSVHELRTEISDILQKENIPEPQGRAVLSGFSSNEVYEKLWLVSNTLDTFIGPVIPSVVFERASHALAEIDQIAKQHNVKLSKTPPTIKGVIPKDVDIEGYRNLYRIKKIQRQLGIKTNPVASFPIGEITPSDVYDTLILMIAELSRIRTEKQMAAPEYTDTEVKDKKPSDVLALMEQFGQTSELILINLKGE